MLDLAQDVARNQYGATAIGERTQELPQPGGALGVQAVCRFVEHQHPRLAQQCGGQRQALPHAEGERADLRSGGALETDEGEHPGGLAAGHTDGGGEDLEMADRGAPGVQADGVEHRADRSRRIRKARIRNVIEERHSRGRPDQPEHHPQRGGLARTVRSEKGRDGTRRHRKTQIVDRADLAELLAEIDCSQADSVRSGERGTHRRLRPTVVVVVSGVRIATSLLAFAAARSWV